MANVNQIVRPGFDPVNVSDRGDQFIFQSKGIDLIVFYLANSTVHSIGEIVSEVSLATIPLDNIEIDFLNIDFSYAKMTIEKLNEALFFISQLETLQFIGQTIITGCALADLDQGILLDLITKNFIISEE